MMCLYNLYSYFCSNFLINSCLELFFSLIKKILYLKIKLGSSETIRDKSIYNIGENIVQSIYKYIGNFNYLFKFFNKYFSFYKNSKDKSNKFKSEFFNNNFNESPDNDPKNKNNKLITIKIKKSFDKLHSLNVNNLLSKPIMVFYNALLDKDNIIRDYKNVSGIYLLHNSVNGKQYIGSGYYLSTRLSSYYYPSRLIDKRHISNSILKYGHDNFSLVILDILGSKDYVIKTDLIEKEQYYINLYKPALNINAVAGSTLGF